MPLSRLLGSAVALVAFASAAASAEESERGRELFDLCTQCHGSAGLGNRLALAPAIAGMGEWYLAEQLRNFKSGKRGTHPADLGGLRMHPMSRTLKTDADIQAVAAYVASLPDDPAPAPVLEGGDPRKGEALYVVCKACHGPDGAGIRAMNAPRLKGTSDWYLLTTLEKFKAGIRGGVGSSQNSVLMRGMALSLADEQAIKDVIAYVQTLGDGLADDAAARAPR